MQPVHMAIQLEQLTKVYRGRTEPALAEVNLAIAPGELFGLLGPNGAGKSTLISIVCGLLSATAGKVTVRGSEVKMAAAQVKEWIGLVPQNIALYPRLTARENLAFFGRMQGLRGKQLHQKIAYWLDQVGLGFYADLPISTYSGGMKRRANLVAGLLHEPSILILDEPTAGVDPQSRNLIYENLLRLNHSGTTLLYTTHYLKEAEQLCSRIAILDAGRVIAEGIPRELIQKREQCHNLEDLFLLLTGKQLRDEADA
jgi:ABC-2 type transport system ATP-binding protein